MADPTLDLIDRISSFVERQAPLYSHIEVGLCLIRADGDLHMVTGKVMPRPRLDSERKPETLDYGSIVLSLFHVATDEFSALMKGIHQGNVEHPQFGALETEVNLQTYGNRSLAYYRKESLRSYGYATSTWPYLYLKGDVKRDQNIPLEALVSRDLPLYPNWYTGAHYLLGLGDESREVSDLKHLLLLVPDPRARIDQMRLRGEEVQVVLGRGELGLDAISLKVYGSFEDEVQHKDIQPDDWSITHQFPFEPREISVHVVTEETGEDLDWREFYLGWGHMPAGVVIEREEGGLLELLSRGESQNVEFKRLSGDPNFDINLCKAISAFANTDGGILFIGVDDEGRPTDNVDPSEEDRIVKIVTSHIDTPVEDLHFQQMTANERNILVVEVPEGENKPYVLKDYGTFVRRNATSRQATRAELVAMVSQSGPAGFRTYSL